MSTPISRRLIVKALGFGGVAVSTGLAASESSRAIPSPDQRIAAAIAEIEAALREKHPEWSVQVVNHPAYVRMGSSANRVVDGHGVLVCCSSERAGHWKARWFRDFL